jgi:hypothetical protein
MFEIHESIWTINPIFKSYIGEYNITVSKDSHPYMKLIGWTPVIDVSDSDNTSIKFVNKYSDYDFKVLPPDKRSDGEIVEITQTVRSYTMTNGNRETIECKAINPYISEPGSIVIRTNAFMIGAHYKIQVMTYGGALSAFIGKLVVLENDRFMLAWIDDENVCSSVTFTIDTNRVFMRIGGCGRLEVNKDKIMVWEI